MKAGEKSHRRKKIVLLKWLAFLYALLLVQGTTFSQTKLRFDIFTQEEGLPNNQIQCMYQDSMGWMWVGTSQGLSRFDGYSFVNYLPDRNDSTCLKGNIVRVIKEDASGNLLVGTENGGLNIYHRSTESFSHPFEELEGLRGRDISVNDVVQEKDGYWLATDNNVLRYDPDRGLDTLKPAGGSAKGYLEGNFVRKLEFDRKGSLWIGTNRGLYTYYPADRSVEAMPLPFNEFQDKEIWELYLDEEGLLWIGTYSAGMFIIDPESREILRNERYPGVDRTETVKSISKGMYGEYWIGTRGGLLKYSKTVGFTGIFRNNIQEPNSLSANSVLSIFNDARGETWIGTRGGLNLLARSKQVFQNYSALPGNRSYLNSGTIYAFWTDPQGRVWIGTEDGGINVYNPETKTYRYITSALEAPYALSQNCIKAFLNHGEDLYVATYLGGLNVIDLNTWKVKHFTARNTLPGSISDNRVWDLCKDQGDHIWVATSKGVDRLDLRSGTFTHFPQLCGEENVAWIEMDSQGNLWLGTVEEVVIYSPSTKRIQRFSERSRGMCEDSDHRIWIATDEQGLARYNAEEGPVQYYGVEQGLVNRQALCVLEDNDRKLWISTTNGLSKFDPATEVFQNFTTRDGLGSNQFCYGAALKTPSGELLFGSISGFDLVNPAEIPEVNADAPLVFTDFKIFNTSVPIGKGKKDVLRESISVAEELVLSHKQNIFSLEYAALNFVHSENNLYAYKMEGLFDEWIGPSHDRVASFTNLNPGHYTFRVKRVFQENDEESRELQLSIVVLPPFWKTGWFLAIIILLLLLTIYVLVKSFINKEKIKNQLILERVNARKLHELDMLKLKFFTNISHEIRTPLTLILGPLEKMLNAANTNAETRENLKLMHRNAINLNRLITQLLDFRKLQSGTLKLKLTEADIVGFIRNTVESFQPYAEEKGIRLTFTSLKKRLFISFDPDKIEKIINNLLSNAFKYTEPKGSISVTLSLVFNAEEEDFTDQANEKQFIEISVKDTGKGIARENLNKVFVRFFQSADGDKNAGVGIGLALVKELVQLHHGKISVSSKAGKGTKFTIRIPANMAQEVAMEGDSGTASYVLDNQAVVPEEDAPKESAAPVMLIVEDNMDVRQFIRSHFNAFYRIIEANNGLEGLSAATEHIPDIIISDIIMPNMDGYELCKKLKNDERTSHIPVMLLTAMHSKDHELKGLVSGANDYITKPFDISVLQAKVDNLLSIRDSMKERFASTVVLEPTNVVIPSPDQRFLKKAIDVIEENMSDADLDIEGFAQKVGVSRMQLYRKLHALTNMTVKEFIRHIRLKRATQLLVQEKLNVSEIAYAVGFKDLSHFRKCFKAEYGMSAREYISKHAQSQTVQSS